MRFFIASEAGPFSGLSSVSIDSTYYYVATHSQWRRIDAQRGELSVEAGVKRFYFATDDSAVRSEYLPVSYASLPKRDALEDHEKFEALTAPIFVAEAGVWIQVFNTGSRLTQMQERLLMLAGVATGGVIGFLWGMRDKGNANLPELQSQLQSDTELWRAHEKQLRQICQVMRQDSAIREASELLKETESSQTPEERALKDKTEKLDVWVENFSRVHPEMRSCYVELPSLTPAPAAPSEHIQPSTSTK